MRVFTILLLVTSLSFADTVTLRDGRTVYGSFIGGDTRTIRIATGDRVETYSVSDVANINFDSAPLSNADPEPPRVFRPEPRPERREDPRRAFAEPPMIPSGTILTIRMVDSVDSERDRVGQTFRAALDEPVFDGNGNTMIPRGSDVVVKLVDDQQSGKIEGRTIMTLDVVSLNINGRPVDIDTTSITEQSDSRGARSAKVIGGTAVLGTIIGAIAGGGKGAAIGAASGAGVGTAAQVMTKGQRVRIPSETRLTFTLQRPVNF
jgi:hypothetical protein